LLHTLDQSEESAFYRLEESYCDIVCPY